MRIGLNARFCAAPVSGVQRFARGVAGPLSDLADVVALAPAGVDAERLPAGMDAVTGSLRGHAWEQLELPRQARRAGCDVVLHPANTAPVLDGAAVLVLHDATALTHPEWYSPRFALWYRLTVRRAARAATRLATVSEAARSELARALDVPAGRIAVVPQGVAPFDSPAEPAAVRRVRERFGLPERYLLATGAGDPRKRLDFLLEVMKRWRDADAGAPPLVVVGRALERVHGSAAGERAGGVRFLGRVEDEELRALYTGAAAFCFPSAAEGFGRPPLEAMACGAPVVAADYSAAREVLGDAAAVLPLDAQAWLTELRSVAAGSSMRAERRERGMAHARRWGWDAAAAELVALCRQAAGGDG